jgi:hypothetical protein
VSNDAITWALGTERPPTERFVLVVLADLANDKCNDICYPGVPYIMKRTGLSRASVMRSLKSLERDGLISVKARCTEKGRQTSNLYTVNWRPAGVVGAAVLVPDARPAGPKDLHSAAPLGVSLCAGRGSHCEAPGGLTVSPLEPLVEPKKEKPYPNSRSDGGVQCSKPKGKVVNPDDMLIAQWMFSLVRGVRPDCPPPNWPKWASAVRLMRERDGRTHAGIRELFGWVNAHHYWGACIVCPSALRRGWDKLEIKRKAGAPGSFAPGGRAGPVPAMDCRCAFHENGARCAKPGASSVGVHLSSPWYCGPHLDRVEGGDMGDPPGSGALVVSAASAGAFEGVRS